MWHFLTTCLQNNASYGQKVVSCYLVWPLADITQNIKQPLFRFAAFCAELRLFARICARIAAFIGPAISQKMP